MRTAGLLILIGLIGCKKEDAQAAAPPPPPLVTVSKPEIRKNLDTYMNTTGRTQAVATVEIRARVEGFLEKMNFEVGKRVEKDQILFVIQKEDYEAQRDSASAALEAAKADQEKAESDLERFEEALKSNAVSKVQVTQAKAELLRAEAAILNAKAALRRANLSLSYCDVRSPIEGMVGRNLVDIGNLVGPQGTALLTTVVARKPIYCYFEITEQWVNYALRARAKKEQAGEEIDTVVRIALPDEDEFKHSGIVDWVDNKVDTATGTLRARGVFANQDGLLYSGVFARVRVVLDPIPEAILVKEAALGIDLGGRFLYLVVGEKKMVERRYVKLGQIEGDMRVILDGLEGDETYVSEGIIRVRPGLPVRTEAEPAGGAKQ